MDTRPNPELLKMALEAVDDYVDSIEKTGFVPGGGLDPAMAGGAPPMGGGAPPMGGGALPMDPAMAGGAPPMDPAAMGMPPAAPPAPAPAPAPAGGGEQIKPKIDVNVEIMQIKNMLAKITDALGIQMPAQDMVATPEKLTEMAQGGGPAAGAGAGEGGSAISPPAPIDPIQAAAPEKAGAARTVGSGFDTRGLSQVSNRAAAVARIRGIQNNSGTRGLVR